MARKTTRDYESAQTLPAEPDEEMPVYAPLSGSDPAEPLLPLVLPDDEMRDSLKASTEKTLAALPDPGGKDVIVKWAARIEVLQAYRFDGVLHTAPQWIDRNWLAWNEGDGYRGGDDPAGPALNVTRPDGTHVGTVRKGDYVVRQNTTVDDPQAQGGLRVLPDHLAVVTAAEFERLFRPVRVKLDAQLEDVAKGQQAA